MNFAQLNVVFLVVAGLVFAAALWQSRSKRMVAGAVMVAGLVLVILTAVFDNVMIASGLFDYASHTLHGLHVGLAPIEDFAYPLGAALLLPGLWILFTGRGRT